MVPEFVFVTKANLLSGVISTQHGATWVVVEQGQDSGRGVELIDADRPVERGAGDDAVGHRQGPPRRVEGDLCRHGCGAAGERERLKGACDRRQLSVGSGPVALDRPGSRVGAVDVERPGGSEVALVEHVDDVAVAVDADRQVARGHRAHELEAAAGQHAKRAQRVAAGVDGEHEVPAVGELDAARGVEDLEGEGRGGVVPDAARRGARRLRQRPSAARVNTTTSLPATALVCVYTEPGRAAEAYAAPSKPNATTANKVKSETRVGRRRSADVSMIQTPDC